MKLKVHMLVGFLWTLILLPLTIYLGRLASLLLFLLAHELDSLIIEYVGYVTSFVLVPLLIIFSIPINIKIASRVVAAVANSDLKIRTLLYSSLGLFTIEAIVFYLVLESYTA